MRKAWEKKINNKDDRVKTDEDWNKLCTAYLMVLLGAMYPEFKTLMQLARDLKQKKEQLDPEMTTVATHLYQTRHNILTTVRSPSL